MATVFPLIPHTQASYMKMTTPGVPHLVVLHLPPDYPEGGVAGMMIDVDFRYTSRRGATGQPLLLHVIIHHDTGANRHYGMFTENSKNRA